MSGGIRARGKAERWFVGLGVGLIVVVFAGCFHAPDKPRWPAAEFDWLLDLTDAGIRTVRMRIPPGYNRDVVVETKERIVYLDGRPKAPHVQSVLLLETLWPEMAPHTRSNDEEFKAQGGGRAMSILIDSGAIDPKAHAIDQLHRILNATISRYLSRICIPRRGPDAHCFDLKEPDIKPDRFGLKHIGVDFSRHPEIAKDDYRRYRDIYYTPDLGERLHTLISCTPDEDEINPSPHCRQHFLFKPMNAWVHVNYHRVQLKDWKEIQAAVETLLQSFIIGQSQNISE